MSEKKARNNNYSDTYERKDPFYLEMITIEEITGMDQKLEARMS